MKRVYKIFISISGVALLIAVVVMVMISFRTFSQIERSAEARRHTFSVVISAEDLLSELKDAETGQRGYLLTGDEAFLEPYLAVQGNILGHLKELRQITLISAADEHLNAMTPLIDSKLAEMSKAIELRRNNDMPAALAIVKGGDGKQLMDSIRAEMKSFIQIEEGALLRNDADFRSNLRFMFIIILVTSLFVLLLAILFVYFIYRERRHQLLDVTKKFEHEALEYAESIINTVREPMLSLDHDLRVLKVNSSFYDVFKVKPEETLGQLIYDLGNKQWDIPKLRKLLETILPEKASFDNYEVEHEFAAIGRRIMLLNARQIQRVLGKEKVILLAIEDITEKKRLELELVVSRDFAEAATRAKSEFLANMSHELRTPLNSIIGFSEVLEDQMFGPLNEKQKKYVDNVTSSAKHLLSLINDVLDLSKVEAGKMEFEPEKLKLKETLEYAMDMQKEKALKHNIDLALEITPEADIEIKADERKLKQVMFNLLSNALKFTPDGGKVNVGVKKVNGQIEIGVKDTGLGIKAEDILRLFSEFTQLDSTKTKNFEGTGLGLALTKKLVEMHGGSIRVESAGEGKGSIFTFTLPIKEA